MNNAIVEINHNSQKVLLRSLDQQYQFKRNVSLARQGSEEMKVKPALTLVNWGTCSQKLENTWSGLKRTCFQKPSSKVLLKERRMLHVTERPTTHIGWDWIQIAKKRNGQELLLKVFKKKSSGDSHRVVCMVSWHYLNWKFVSSLQQTLGSSALVDTKKENWGMRRCVKSACQRLHPHFPQSQCWQHPQDSLPALGHERTRTKHIQHWNWGLGGSLTACFSSMRH